MLPASESQQLPLQDTQSTGYAGLIGGNQKDILARNQNVASTTGSADIMTRLRDTLNLDSSLSSPVAKTDLVAPPNAPSNESKNTTDSIVGNNNTPVGDLKNDSLLTNTTSATGGSTPPQPASPPPTGNSSQNQPVAQSQPAAPASVSAGADVLTFPTGFMKSIADYGAIANDGIDDTAAIQKALDEDRRDANGNSLHSDYNGLPKALYFQAGTYDVSGTLNWDGSNLTLQGQGSDATIIKLKDNAAGFNNSSAPKAVIQTPDGNMSFRQNIYGLTVDIGKGNDGAIGIDYISNNVGAMRDVKIRSGDGNGSAGLAMDRFAPGPCLIKNVEIDGFKYGIRVSPGEYGPTFENITLKNQQVAGINSVYGTITIRKLQSTNSVPVFNGEDRSNMLTLIDADLQGGASNVSAIQTPGEFYVRNINTSGYQSAVKYKDTVVPGTTLTEYASNTDQLFDGSKQSLNLAVKETPEYHDNNMANWGRFEPRWYGDTDGFQALLNSGASTIYLPSSVYYSFDEKVFTVPASVKQIIAFSSVINGDGRGKNGGGIKLVSEENSSDPLIIEGFGYGVRVQQDSSRPVVLKDGQYDYKSNSKAGDLFIENAGTGQLTIQPGQKVFARQYNNEYEGTKVINNGGDFWALGMKTEKKGIVIETKNNGNTELLGGFILPVAPFSTDEKKNMPAFKSDNSNTSLVYRSHTYNPDYGYGVQVEDTRNGETRQLNTQDNDDIVSLYAGKKA